MGLETVVEDIRADARARADELRKEADERAAEIVAAAEQDAESIREDAETAAERRIAQEREQALSSAKLEAKQERLRARRTVLEDVRADVEERLAALEGDRRRELTAALLDAAAAEFDDADTAEVYSRPADADLVEDLLAEHHGFERAGDVDCLGGVIVESEDAQLRVNNTFDSVIEIVWEDRLKDISDRLFEE